MKQKLENVMRNKKVMIALMEIAIAIGCIVIFYLLMSTNNRAKETTYSYSKVEEVTEYRVVDNYITRVMPLTSYETFKEIAEDTLNNALEDVQYAVKVYSDAEKTEEVIDGYIASGMVVEAIERVEEVPTEDIEQKTDEILVEEQAKETTGKIYTISVLGDMTNDGNISITELTKLIKGVVGLTDWSFTEEEKLSADISGDNEINVVDIELCINYIVFGQLELEEATYTVTFKDYDGREISKNRDYHYGDTIEIPEEPTRESDGIYTYEFAGWAPVISERVTKDEVYVATYRAIEIATEAGYKVEHYKETKEGTYELAETEELVGKIGEEVTAIVKEYTGFTQNVESEEKIVAGTVLEDGSLVLKLYYNRNTYTVTFKDEDGTVLSTKTYKYEDTVEVPENPSKAEDETYTYEFAGWDKEVEETVTGNAEYTATYTSTYKEYTVVFKNEDGSVINSRTYHYGDKIEIPENPSKAEDETYTYTFDGWDKEVEETVTGNTEYTATYTSTYKEYIVTFKDEDGTVLTTKTDYHYGDTVEVPEEPSKEADETYTYEFAGWDKEITTVKGNTEYIAVYTKKYINYTVVFKDENGNIINSKVYHYGDTLVKPQDPVKESTIEHAYTFTGWTPEIEGTVTKNAEYTATFDEEEIKYSIIFYNYDGITEVLKIEEYKWGNSFVFPENPIKEPTEEINYVFSGWKNLGVEDISATEKKIKLVAQYREEYFVARVEATENLRGVSYFSLEEAIEKSGEEARTIRLLQDTEESVMIEDDQNITINLNGKTVTGTKNYAIKNYGELVLTDESEEKTGKIVDVVSSEVGYGIHNKEGQVTIKAGTIVTETSQESGATYGIYNQSEEPLVIEGGSIIAEAKGKGSVSAGIYNLAGKEITVTGGYVLGNATAENATSYGIYNETEGKINVTNGRVEGKTSLASGISYGIYNEISQEVTISGGTVAAQSDKSTAYGVYNIEGNITVTEGNIEVTAATGYGIYNETGVVDVQSGKTTMIGTTSYAIYNNAGTTNVSGGNIELTSSTAYGIYNNNQMNITGGEIIAKTSSSSTYGIYNNSDKDFNIENIRISGVYYGIYNKKEKMELTNSTIIAQIGIYNNSDSANIIINSAEIPETERGIENNRGSINIKNANISSNKYGILNYYGNVTIENANINSQEYGVCNNDTGNIEIGTKDENISTERPNIYGKTNAIHNSVTSTGKVKYYDGILIGKSVIYGGVNEIEENSEIIVTTNEEENEVAILQNIEEVVVAKIGENTYTSLSSAVEAVPENVTDTTKIELITDFDVSNLVQIPESKKVTIDFAGHTVTTYAKGGITNTGTLTITDSTEEAQGKIVSGIGIGISNEGNLTIANATIKSSKYGIYNYGDGKVIVKGGIIEGTTYGIYNESANTNVTIEEGRISSSSSGIYNEKGVVNVKGGDIERIYNSRGTINISGGQIRINKTNLSAIYCSIGNINVNGGKISNENGYGIEVHDGVNVNITGGEIEGTIGIENYDSNITIGTKDSNVQQELPKIIGKTYGIDMSKTTTDITIKYYDGKILGRTEAVNGTINELETGKKVEKTTETINEVEYKVLTLVDEDVYDNGIAQIGETVYKTPSSLKQAISEIPVNTEESVKVTTLDNFEMTQEIVVENNQNVEIDLNGKTITSMSSIINKGTLEITDSTENYEGKFINENYDAIINRNKLTITKGSVVGQRYGIYTFTSNVTIGAEDGEVKDELVLIEGNTYGICGEHSSDTIEMYDGMIKGISNSATIGIRKTEEGYKVHDYSEENYDIIVLQPESPIAQIGEQKYYNLQDAINNCQNGETIEILRNVESLKNTIIIAEGKNIALDLKKYTINSKLDKTIINKGTLNISKSNGTIKNTQSNAITIENNGELNLFKGTIESNYGTAVQNNGLLNVDGGSIDGRSYGINNNENATVVMTSGSIKSHQYAIYNNSINTINIVGGLIETSSGSYNTKYGIYNNAAADIVVTGGSIKCCSYESESYVYGIYNNSNGNISVSTLERIEVTHSAYGYGIYNNGEGKVIVEKGSILTTGNYLSYGIRNTSTGKIELKAGDISATSKDGHAYGIENGSSGRVEIINGNITANTTIGTAYGIRNYTNPLIVKQGIIKATGKDSYGICSDTSELVIGENNKDLTMNSPIIESNFVGIYIRNVGKFNFYDGQVIGKQAINVDTNTPEGYKVLKYYDNEKQKEVAILSEVDNYVLTYYLNGDKYYSVILKAGELINLLDVQIEGYEFNGWENLPSIMPKEDINIYGTATPKVYKATYYVDNEIYGEIENVQYNNSVIPREIPEKENRIFVGWEGIPSKMPAKDIEIRGYFTYTATFYGEDGETVLGTDEFTIKDSKLAEPEIPHKDGYIGIWYAYEIKAEDLNIQLLYMTEDELENAVAINVTKGKAYDSLQSAITAVSTDEEENIIKLLKDTNESTKTTLGQNIILDLNGKKISVNAIMNNSVDGIKNYGTLTIQDSSEETTGSIEISSETGTAIGIRNANGTLTILGGKIITTGEEEVIGIYNYKGTTILKKGDIISTDLYGSVSTGIENQYGNVIVEGGNISVTGVSSMATGVYNYYGNLEVAEGNIEVTGSFTSRGISNRRKGTTIVSGGKVIVKSQSNDAYGIDNNTETTVNILGGSITGTSESGIGYGIYNDNTGTVSIGAGKITATSQSSDAYGIYNGIGNVTIKGGNIEVSGKSYNTYGVWNNNTGTVTVEAGNIKATSGGFGIYNYNTGTVNMAGGRIETDGMVISNNSSGIVNISGGILISKDDYYGLSNNGTINITGGTVIATNGAGMYNNDSGTTNISGGNINAFGSGINNYGNVLMTGGTIVAGNDANGIWNHKTVTIGTKDGIINLDEPKISGIIVNDQYYDTVCNYYDGQILGKENTIDGIITEIEEGTQLKEETVDIDGEQYKKLTLIAEEQYKETIALINGNGDYKTVSSLIEAINNIDSEEETEIKILQDIQLPINGLEIGSNQNIVLDLNGKEIKILSGKIVNNGVLTIKDTTEEESGTINSRSECAIYNNSDLTIENGNITSINHFQSSRYGIYNNGNMTMKAGTIIVKDQMNNYSGDGIFNKQGTINILGGNICAAVGICDNGNGESVITLGTEDDTISLKEPKILGRIDNYKAKFKYYDGEIIGKGGAISEKSIIEIQEGAQIKEEIVEIEGEQYTKITLTPETEYKGNIALINNEGYYRTATSLIKAINEIETQEIIEVKLLQDISLNGLEIGENKTLELDLNGNEIKLEYGKISNNGKLTLKDTSEEKTGRINSKSGYGIYNNSEFILESGNIILTTTNKIAENIYGIYNATTGRTLIKGGTITCTNNSKYGNGAGVRNYGVMTVTGGNILSTGNYNYGIENGEGTLTIGIKDGLIDNTNPIIEGGSGGIVNSSGTIFNFYDGKVIGTSYAIYGTANDTEDGYKIKTKIDETSEKQISYLGVENGDIVKATVNGITWNYTYQDGNADDVYYESGNISSKVVIPSELNGCPVVRLSYYPGYLPYKNIFAKSNKISSISEIVIPESVKEIGSCAFKECTGLTSIKIPESVNFIGEFVFEGCNNLRSINIPEGITHIYRDTFMDCTKLKSIRIPNSVISMGYRAFYNCSGLTDMYINNLEEDITFDSNWGYKVNAYVHYSDCKHTIEKGISEEGIEIQDVSDNLTDNNIPCEETYKFKLVNSSGETIKDKSAIIRTLGKDRYSEYTEVTILPNADGIFEIKSVDRDKVIVSTAELTSGMKVTSIDENGIAWTYTYQDGQAVDVHYESGQLSHTVNIPDSLNGYKVVNLYNSSVYGNIFAKSYDEINTIVKNINIPDSEIAIGQAAFRNCKGLEKIRIPKDVVSISYGAFYYCTNLSDIYVDSDIYIDTYGTSAYIHRETCEHNIKINMYSKNDMEIVEVSDNRVNGKIPCGKTYKFKLINQDREIIKDEIVSVKSQGLFLHSEVVKEQIIPDEEGIYTIENINRNKIITIGQESHQATDENGITWNYSYEKGNAINVYYASGNLPKTLNIPSHLDGYPVRSLYNSSEERSIFAKAEYSYEDLERVVEENRFLTNPEYYSSVQIETINIPDTVEVIGDNAFEICTNVKNINIGNNVTTIGNYAFFGCTSLISINVPNNVTDIGNYAFGICSRLTNVTLSDKLTKLSDYTLYFCTSLKDITIPDNVVAIGNKVFQECNNLENIKIPDGITRIGVDAFYGTPWYRNQPDGEVIYAGKVAYEYKGEMPSNTVIELKDGTECINKTAFQYCSNLVEVIIPDSVTRIEKDSFLWCENLAAVTMSKNIEYIGEGAFAHCTNLSEIIIWKSLNEMGYRTFGNWGDNQKINIELNEIPSGWHEEWNKDCNAEIVYAYTGD